jgi:hypothetical protein
MMGLDLLIINTKYYYGAATMNSGGDVSFLGYA